MTITAKIIADSAAHNPAGQRITTMELRYPRFIHAEFMTHRLFSRNASSSRAIPVQTLIHDVIDDPVNPSFWGKNEPGMQASVELDERHKQSCQREWDALRDNAIRGARYLSSVGAHKQIANRILEPFAHINVVVTATEWDNFFALRRHPDAQPEIHELADRMYEALESSTPDVLKHGEWHTPYAGRNGDKRVSAARCARVSYLTHDGKEPTEEADLALFDRLAGSVPIHASPLEHQAKPVFSLEEQNDTRNFVGWVQFRAIWERGINNA